MRDCVFYLYSRIQGSTSSPGRRFDDAQHGLGPLKGSTRAATPSLVALRAYRDADPVDERQDCGEELHGPVVAIAGGDTVLLLTNEMRQVHIRLSDINAPERRQPYGSRAADPGEYAFQPAGVVSVVDTYLTAEPWAATMSMGTM
jgi:endonuclease YncB( thermonuclease family)